MYTIPIQFTMTAKDLAGCVNSAIDPATFGSRRWIKEINTPTHGTYYDVLAADKGLLITTIEGHTHVLNCFKLAAGMAAMLTPKGRAMMINLDPGAWDANLADELLQHTLFGELVYD